MSIVFIVLIDYIKRKIETFPLRESRFFYPPKWGEKFLLRLSYAPLARPLPTALSTETEEQLSTSALREIYRGGSLLPPCREFRLSSIRIASEEDEVSIVESLGEGVLSPKERNHVLLHTSILGYDKPRSLCPRYGVITTDLTD